MNILDVLGPQAGILLIVVFVALVIWANNPNKIGRAVSNHKWYNPLNLFYSSSRWRIFKLFLLIIVVCFAGMVIYDFDVVWYPGNFHSYLEKYADFIIDPFGNHPFKTRVEVSHCTWKKGYSVKKFDGKYWAFDKYVIANGTDTPILEPETLAVNDTKGIGEAVIGQRKIGHKIEEYCVYFRDVNTKEIYKCDGLVMFLRVSDRNYSLKSLNSVLYNYFRNNKDNWKTIVFKYDATRIIYIRLFLPDKKFDEVRRL